MKKVITTLVSATTIILNWEERTPSQFVMSRKWQAVAIDTSVEMEDWLVLCVAADPKTNVLGLHSWWTEYRGIIPLEWLEDYDWDTPERALKYDNWVVVKEIPKTQVQKLLPKNIPHWKTIQTEDEEDPVEYLHSEIMKIHKGNELEMFNIKLELFLTKYFYKWRK